MMTMILFYTTIVYIFLLNNLIYILIVYLNLMFFY